MARRQRLRDVASAHEATTACYVGSCGQELAGIPMGAFQRTLQGMIWKNGALRC
jgi:hypothetical protein